MACAFLADRAAMEKRIVRAKRIIADDGQLFEVSTPEQAGERMPAVLTAIYLTFDAGYHGSVVPEPVRADLCADAIRLATLLAASPATATAEVDALRAGVDVERLPAEEPDQRHPQAGRGLDGERRRRRDPAEDGRAGHGRRCRPGIASMCRAG